MLSRRWKLFPLFFLEGISHWDGGDGWRSHRIKQRRPQISGSILLEVLTFTITSQGWHFRGDCLDPSKRTQ